MADSQYLLRFISGKYQGGEFPVAPDRDVTIGRGAELDMVLNEDMVSRRHARILAANDAVTIEDLGSTNGTFVNGEKVSRSALRDGDRILIGSSLIKLVRGQSSLSAEGARRNLEAASRQRATGSIRPIAGSIDDFPLPDLIQLLSTSRKSGVLAVNVDGDDGGIYFRDGQIFYATLSSAPRVDPRKALFRMLSWTSGTFALEPPENRAIPEEIQGSTEGLLMEGMRRLDERTRLEGSLPVSTARITLAAPLEPSLRDLAPEELDVLQLAINHGRLDAVLDGSGAQDLETLTILKKLIDAAFLATARDP